MKLKRNRLQSMQSKQEAVQRRIHKSMSKWMRRRMLEERRQAHSQWLYAKMVLARMVDLQQRYVFTIIPPEQTTTY